MKDNRFARRTGIPRRSAHLRDTKQASPVRCLLLLMLASAAISCFASKIADGADLPASASPEGRSLLVVGDADSIAGHLRPLLDFRRKQGWGVIIRILEQATPDSISSVVSSEREQHPGLSHLLLVGSHSSLPYASRPNYLIQQTENDVPILTDDPYGLPDPEGVPQLAVGRLAADGFVELRQLATKIVRYESSLSGISRQAFLLAGRQPAAGGGVGSAGGAQAAVDGMSMAFVEEARQALTNLELRARTAFPGPQSFAFEEAVEVLRGGFSARPLMAAYAGHGSREGFATFHDPEHVTSITRDDVAKLVINEICGPFVSCGCSMLDPEGEGPAIGNQIFLLRDGPVAVAGFTRINDDFYAAQLLETLVGELTGPRTTTLGELIRTLKDRLAHEPQSPRSRMFQNMMLLSGQMRPEAAQLDYPKAVRKNNAMLILLGDPTTTIVIP